MSVKDVGAPAKARVVHSTLSSRIGMAFWLVLTAVLVALPYWGDRQMMRLATEIYSFVALASLWNFLAGYAGLVSVGQQTFVGLGGYTLYLCALWAGLNPMLGLPLAGVIGALISVPIVLLLLKLRGAYFTIGSWVVAEVFLQIFQLVPAVGGGSSAGDRGPIDRKLSQRTRVLDLLGIPCARCRRHRRDRAPSSHPLWACPAGDPR